VGDRLGDHGVDHAHDPVDDRLGALVGPRGLRAERDDVAAVFSERAGDDVCAAEVDADMTSLPSSASAPATMFVPPRSTPTRYLLREVMKQLPG
jgi:hypothetical protein